MAVRSIQKSHRVAIPQEIWEGLGLREGDEVEVIREGGRIIILPVSRIENPTEALWNLSKRPIPTDQPDVIIAEAMAEKVEKELRRKVR